MAATFPGLGIDPATDVRSISLERHEADIAVRIGLPDDGDVIAKPVATIAYGFYDSQSVRTAGRGRGARLHHLRRGRCPLARSGLVVPPLSSCAAPFPREQPVVLHSGAGWIGDRQLTVVSSDGIMGSGTIARVPRPFLGIGFARPDRFIAASCPAPRTRF